MKTYLILNPNAGSAEQSTALQEVIATQADLVLRETTRAGQGRELAREALQGGYECIVAAGGDGTINEVVNGLAPDFASARLGIIPLGTGNDLARTLAIPTDPVEAVSILTTGQERQLDVMKIEAANQVVYGLNIAAGGFTGQMNEVLTDELKKTWGPLAYLIGTASVFPNLTEYETTITWNPGQAERIEALNIIVANGRTAAGGFHVAPTANPEDGLLDIVIVRSGSFVDLAGISAQLLAGSYLDNEHVLHPRVQRLTIASRPGMWFNVDGELLTKEPLTFTVCPQALRVVVGSTYTPTPDMP